jgi:hypothetical protein
MSVDWESRCVAAETEVAKLKAELKLRDRAIVLQQVVGCDAAKAVEMAVHL